MVVDEDQTAVGRIFISVSIVPLTLSSILSLASHTCFLSLIHTWHVAYSPAILSMSQSWWMSVESTEKLQWGGPIWSPPPGPWSAVREATAVGHGDWRLATQHFQPSLWPQKRKSWLENQRGCSCAISRTFCLSRATHENPYDSAYVCVELHLPYKISLGRYVVLFEF